MHTSVSIILAALLSLVVPLHAQFVPVFDSIEVTGVAVDGAGSIWAIGQRCVPCSHLSDIRDRRTALLLRRTRSGTVDTLMVYRDVSVLPEPLWYEQYWSGRMFQFDPWTIAYFIRHRSDTGPHVELCVLETSRLTDYREYPLHSQLGALADVHALFPCSDSTVLGNSRERLLHASVDDYQVLSDEDSVIDGYIDHVLCTSRVQNSVVIRDTTGDRIVVPHGDIPMGRLRFDDDGALVGWTDSAMMRSTDSGRTWRASLPFAFAFDDSVTCVHQTSEGSMVVGTTNGRGLVRIYVAEHDAHAWDPYVLPSSAAVQRIVGSKATGMIVLFELQSATQCRTTTPGALLWDGTTSVAQDMPYGTPVNHVLYRRRDVLPAAITSLISITGDETRIEPNSIVDLPVGIYQAVCEGKRAFIVCVLE